MCAMPSGLRIWCSMGCCAPVSSHLVFQREVRDLTRSRSSLVEERSRVINRVQKLLEDATIKLASVAADLLGKSARQMLAALVEGQEDPAILAEYARASMRPKRPLLEQALQGRVTEHHRLLLKEHLAHIDALDERIEHLSTELRERLRPYEAQLRRLETIPGIKRRFAEVLLAEIGPEMSRFPSARHLASWAGMCPGNAESAGKRLSGKTWPRESVATLGPGRGRPCGDAQQGVLSHGPISAPLGTAGSKEGGGCGGAYPAGHRLSCPGRGARLSGVRWQLL
jgi:transposase